MKDVEEIKKALINGYDHSFWSCSVSKLGYSGTAIISRVSNNTILYAKKEERNVKCSNHVVVFCNRSNHCRLDMVLVYLNQTMTWKDAL